MSSGSSREDSAVEPTRSQNITVSWRRSAELARRAPRRTTASGGREEDALKAAIAFRGAYDGRAVAQADRGRFL